MKVFIRSKNFRVGSIFIACLLLCISFVPLFSKPVNEANADSVQVHFTFDGSDLFIPYSTSVYSYNSDFGGYFVSHPVTDKVLFMNLSCSLMTYDEVTVGGYNSTSSYSVYVPDCPAPVHNAFSYNGNSILPLYTDFFQNSVGQLVKGEDYSSGVLATYAYNINSSGQNVNIKSVADVKPSTIFRYTQYFNFSDTLDYVGSSEYIGPRVDTYIQYGFSSDVVSVRLYGETVYPSTYGSRNIQYKNHIVYYDSKAFECEIVVTGYLYNSQNNADPTDNVLSSLIFDDRIYYLNPDLDYEEGRLAGIVEGEKNKIDFAQSEVEKARLDWQNNLETTIAVEKKKAFDDGEAYGFQRGVGSDFGLERFLSSAFSALDVKIFGVFSLGELFALIMGVSLVFIVLKIFAGG